MGRSLSRWSRAELRDEALAEGIVAEISGSTIWRGWTPMPSVHGVRRRWIFPRDPRFAERAAPVLDLYHRQWEGGPLGMAVS